MNRLLTALMTALTVTSLLAVRDTLPADVPDPSGDSVERLGYEQHMLDWRQLRNDRLSSDDGWLTLVGLEWLQEGENRIGNSDAPAPFAYRAVPKTGEPCSSTVMSFGSCTSPEMA